MNRFILYLAAAALFAPMTACDDDDEPNIKKEWTDEEVPTRTPPTFVKGCDPSWVTAMEDANWRFPKGQTVGKCGEVSRIYFNNIYATSENGCFIGGDTKDKVRDIYLNNVHLNLKKVTSYDGGVYDKRPCRGEGFIYNKVYGVYVEQATNVEVDDLKVIADAKINYGGKTFGIDD